MRSDTIRKLIGLTVILLLAAGTAAAQKKPAAAVKFDEIEVYTDNSGEPANQFDVITRIDRLVEAVMNMRGAMVYVVVYRAQKNESHYYDALHRWRDEIRARLTKSAKLEFKDLDFIWGGYRDEETLEFWIGSENSKAPPILSKYKDSEAFGCPRFKIYSQDYFATGGRVQFYIFDENESWTDEPPSAASQTENVYTWSTSGGKIVGEQGGKGVSVDLEGQSRITVFAERSGLPPPCNRVVFKTVDFTVGPVLIRSLTPINSSELLRWFGNFAILIGNHPEWRGHIIIYESRVRGARHEVPVTREVKLLMAKHLCGDCKLTVVHGGFREHNSIDLWLLPEGADPPEPSPSVDNSFVKMTRKKSRKKL